MNEGTIERIEIVPTSTAADEGTQPAEFARYMQQSEGYS